MHDALAVIRDIISFTILTLVVSILPFLDYIVPFDFNVIVPIGSIVLVRQTVSM